MNAKATGDRIARPSLLAAGLLALVVVATSLLLYVSAPVQNTPNNPASLGWQPRRSAIRATTSPARDFGSPADTQPSEDANFKDWLPHVRDPNRPMAEEEIRIHCKMLSSSIDQETLRSPENRNPKLDGLGYKRYDVEILTQAVRELTFLSQRGLGMSTYAKSKQDEREGKRKVDVTIGMEKVAFEDLVHLQTHVGFNGRTRSVFEIRQESHIDYRQLGSLYNMHLLLRDTFASDQWTSRTRSLVIGIYYPSADSKGLGRVWVETKGKIIDFERDTQVYTEREPAEEYFPIVKLHHRLMPVKGKKEWRDTELEITCFPQ